ncbi:MAG TPA: DPP IV N-terminal domain-containing protein [Verrucomicrobiae bacterium]|nr:DPP IV N-terminal domain-containing protein [Verrucomicrobiae bacterium]
MHNASATRVVKLATAFVILLMLRGLAFAQSDTEDGSHDSPQQRRGFGQPERGVYKARITPHWLTNNIQFWYRNDLSGSTKEFILVDAEKGVRQHAFDHDKLAAALTKAAGEEVKADKLPFSEIQFVENGSAITFDAFSKSWRCDLDSYQCATAATNSNSSLGPSRDLESVRPELADAGPPSPQEQTNQPARPRGTRRRGERDVRSPDEKWTAFVHDHNVFVRSESGGTETQLSNDGAESNSYEHLEWSPDSRSLVAWRVEPGDIGLVYLVQSSPPDGGRAVMRQRPYGQAGDKFPKYELNIFDVADHKQTKPEVDRFEHEYEIPQLHWMRDKRHFAWQQEDRGHQRLRVIEASCDDGSVRNLVDERTKTFFWTAHTEDLGVPLVNWLDDDEMIYVSETDGWRHLYLVGEKEGKIKNQITKGEWVIRGIDKIDEDARQVWFRAGGMNADQDPYFIHYYRINFDGTGLVALTEGNGNHTVQFSPDRKYIVDTYSRVDAPPIHELRRTSDGKLVCKLEEADITELKATGWKPPEVFTAKGRDGKTDIWGIIRRPKNLDPSKKYPILESIYNGPQGAYVPKSFSANERASSMTEAGFILVQCDAMGTAFRSKAFHDVCWHNLSDAGFPDRIAWIKTAAEKYSYMDINRVGIFGTSAGGQNAAAAVLFHPEFYKCAVANSGCHDNRLDKASWNEQWMGYMPPDKIWSKDPDNWYSQNSNIDNAAKLRGKLFLIVGEMDDNVPPESTMRFVDALIKARKDFDLLVVPGANHGAASPVTQRRTLDFFVHNLLGKEPPDRNAEEMSN